MRPIPRAWIWIAAVACVVAAGCVSLGDAGIGIDESVAEPIVEQEQEAAVDDEETRSPRTDDASTFFERGIGKFELAQYEGSDRGF